VEIEDGIDGLLHVADMSWTRKVIHPSEMVKKGDSIRAVVLTVDQERKRIALGTKQLEEDPWVRKIPDKYEVGTVVPGEVTKITNFGVFVKLEDDLEGLLHISELANRKVTTPEEVVKVGDEVAVKIIKIDPEQRKIGLSLKDVGYDERENVLDAYRERKALREAEQKARNGAASQEPEGEPVAEPVAEPAEEPATASVEESHEGVQEESA
jgi:small subunit ribosomal protein S1